MNRWLANILRAWAAKYHLQCVADMERENASLKDSLAKERASVAELSGVAAEHAQQAERIAELEEEKASLEAALRVAEKENALLWEVCERDVSRIKSERSGYDRERAISTAATKPDEDEDEDD